MRDGMLFRHPSEELHTDESDSGSWPNPNLSMLAGYTRDPEKRIGGARRGHEGNELLRRVHLGMFPTPMARDGKDGLLPKPHGRHSDSLPVRVGGTLNPMWVEWLMGWPIGWTGFEPLEMDKFRRWRELHFCG